MRLGACLSILLSWLVGCTPAATQRPTYRVVFSQCTNDGPWRKAILEGMQRELSFHPEVEFRVLDAHNDGERQQAQLRSLTPGDLDLLIVTPCESQRLRIAATAEALHARGVPLVWVDEKGSARHYNARIGGDNIEIGRAAARYAASLPRQQGHIIELLGNPGSRPAIERHRGFLQGLQSHPNLRLVGQVASGWSSFSCAAELSALLRSHPEVDLIFAHSDLLGLRASEVCQQLGREKQVRIIGVDGLPGPQGGVELVEDGVLAASVLNLPGGEEAIRTGLRILNGQPYERENTLGNTVIDSTNVLMMRQQIDRFATQQQDIRRRQELMTTLEASYATQHLLLFGLLGALLAVAGFGAIAWRANRRQGQLNRQLALRNEENTRINEQLTEQNTENTRINEQLTEQNTEISRQRNQLEELAAEARANTEAKLRFFTNFSHELRTPLTLILGPLEEMMADKAALTASQRYDLGLMRRNTQRLLQLVNQLMDFRKMEVGKMPVRATEANLVAFVREIVDVFERPARLRGIRMHWLPAVPALTTWFDANVLDKILINLLSNALKFTPDQGQITVRLQPGDHSKSVRIFVEDTGQGISLSDQEHIFEWFYQGGGARAGTAPGSGMGLALALGLARLHRGQLSMRSQPGQGSTFELTLPVELPTELRAPAPAFVAETEEAALVPSRRAAAAVAELPTASAPATTGPAPSDTLVLVIEDNPDVNDFLVRKLQTAFQVRAATDGGSGLRLATELIPDLIVCDVMMPGLSGLEVVAQLRDDWRTSHIPVVLLTARNAPEQQLEGVQSGADLYLTKPFSPAFLLESLRTLLANRNRQREHFRRELSLDTSTVAPNRGDQQFLADLTAIVEANLSRSDLTAEDVGQSMNLSRMQLYRKVKALLSTGVTSFIQNVRLTKARQLLLDESLTVAEVGYELGFSSPSYFSNSFKAKYQISPSEFRALHTVPEG